MSEVTITEAGGTGETPLLPPAAAGSPRRNLRARRDARRALLFKDLKVPRWEDPVGDQPGTRLFIRFKPVAADRLEKFAKSAEKAKDPRKNVRMNAAVIADHTLGIFVIEGHDEDGDPLRVSVDPDAEDATDPTSWPKFDDTLAESLELSKGLPATELVSELFFTDGDLIGVANQLTEWSGFVVNEQQGDDEGN